jgi:hypothetical protein
VTDSTTSDEINVLDQLARQVREAIEAAQKAGATVLRHAMDAGDALNQAQARVSTNWKQWLRRNCFLRVRTAQLYQQLARHRDEIEAVIAQAGELSLRGALRLVSEPRTENKSPEKAPEEYAEPAWKTAVAEMTDSDWNGALTDLGFDRFLQVCPQSWRPKLLERAGGQAVKLLQARRPNKSVKNLSKKDVRLVVDNTATTH